MVAFYQNGTVCSFDTSRQLLLMPEVLGNQFIDTSPFADETTNNEELTNIALNVADTLSIEVDARSFRKELAETSLSDFFDSTNDTKTINSSLRKE